MATNRPHTDNSDNSTNTPLTVIDIHMDTNGPGTVDSDIREILQSNNELTPLNQISDLSTAQSSTTQSSTTQSSTTLSKRKKMIQVAALLLSQSFSLAGYSMLSPFFPKEAKDKGLTETEIGVIFAIFSAVMFIMSPIYGILIARLRPKFMCVSGCFLCGGACVLFGVLDNIEDRNQLLAVALLIRLVEGNGAAMLSVASASLILDSFPSATGMMSSLIEMSCGLGFISGPALGAGFYAIGGYTLPFAVVGGMTVVMSVGLFFVLHDQVNVEPQTQNFLRLLKVPGILLLFLIFCVSSLTVTYLDPVLSDWMTETFDVTPSIVGLVFTSWALLYAVMSPVFGRIVDKGYVYSLMITGIIVSGVGFLFLGPSPLLNFIFHEKHYLWLVIIVCVIEGTFGAAMYVPCYQASLDLAVVNGYEPNMQTYGLISGMINSGTALGAFVGPLLSGYLTDRYTFVWATTIMTFTLISMGVLLLAYVTFMKLTGRPLSPSVEEDEEAKPLLSEAING